MERSSITAEYAFREDNARLKSILSSTRDTKNIKDKEIESRESKSNPCFRHPFPAHDSAKSGGKRLNPAGIKIEEAWKHLCYGGGGG